MKKKVETGKRPEDESFYIDDEILDLADKYYGYVPDSASSKKDKAFISREKYEKGNYIVICVDEMTNGNGYSNRNTSLSLLLASLVKNGNVYVFDTSDELFTWLME